MNESKAAESKSTGVMLIGHGTRDKQGTRQFFQLGERLTQTLAPTPVAACLLEFQHPTIPEGWQTLVGQGVRHIRAAPLLLFAAGHAKQDIPDLLRECQNTTPDVTFDQSRPISRHVDVVDLVRKRIDEVLLPAQCEPDATALVMVGRGNRDPCAQADMRVLTEVVAHRCRFGGAFTAFYAMAQPSLTEVLDSIAASGRFRSIVVHPHLLFEGRLFQAIRGQVDQAAKEHPQMDLHLGNYLGPDAQVAQAIAARIRAHA